jgi:hypothetical protein
LFGKTSRIIGFSTQVHFTVASNLLYKCPVAKLGSKAGNFLSGKRGRERGEPLKIFNLNVGQ